MPARLPLHVRSQRDGNVVVTPVDFPELALDGDSVESTRRAVVERVTRKLGRLSVTQRSPLTDRRKAELDRAEIDIQMGERKGGHRLQVTIGLVVIGQEVSGRHIHLVRAPAVPTFELVVPRREQASADAVPGLTDILRHWTLPALFAADETGEVHLEVVEIPLPGLIERGEARKDPEDRDVFEDSGAELTRIASEGRLDGIDRRDELVERVLHLLASPRRSSVMLVGPHDVGKSALVQEVARRLAADRVPTGLSGRKLWRISGNELIAGSRYTGMWQERARQLVARSRSDHPIVAMGDPVGIIDAGRWSESDNNLGRFLRPYVEEGDLTLICECTAEQFLAAHQSEPSFMDAFQRVEGPEPAPEEAHEIAAAAAHRLEARQKLSFEPESISAALETTRRFEPYRSLPGKVIRLLEETAQAKGVAGGSQVVRLDVVSTFARRTGLPLAILADEVPMRMGEVRAHFEARVLGQAEAVETMVDLVAVIKAALNDAGKPLGTLFFIGPTGVGKTELAKALAEFLFGSRERVVRLDMGEYSSGDAVQRLIGTPWGKQADGELTRRVREQPFCVVLLDEIEKAHWLVFDALLAMLGEGRLTDAGGRATDFRNAIIILTSTWAPPGRTPRGSAS
ncbi:MAG: hypothetical protein DLM67_23195 [Candidatus Nephthysia bennettiae]|nr:MAG: hypothetical protein DLM67_23195 [Candidatus Dormibacteraeota bacterium]